tara:strand:+ start:1778 stop:2656 length:879 start_codon:yes stop_codon:yes gene_type:complete
MKLLMEGWRKYLTEQEEGVPPEQGASEELPAITNQTSFKVFDKNPRLAAKVMVELLKGGEYLQQLQAAQSGQWYELKSPDALKAWVESIGGIEAFAKRAAAIGGKIPAQGLPKSKMPFLPGPKDAQGKVSDVEDALTPGGKYNVDMMEKMEPPGPNAIGRVGTDPNADKFMTAGHADIDNEPPGDDKITIELGGEFAAAEGIPTQTNILFPKALGFAVTNPKAFQGGDLGAYTSTNNEILDGHHRWAAVMLNNPGGSITTFAKIDLTALGTDETLKYLTAIGNALGNQTKTK